MAMLHVPLEFLSRIRKVIILMDDGTALGVDITSDPLPSPTVDADTEKLGVPMIEQIPSPLEEFHATAKANALYEAEIAFRDRVDPYNTKPDVNEATRIARSHYSPMKFSQLNLGAAVKGFIEVFEAEHKRCLDQLSVKRGADTEETRKLLVFARTDKRDDDGIVPEYADDRALIRASISLCSNSFARQENINEKVFVDLPERAKLYQKFYDEFEPAKEED
jgi:hypothetical protein